MKRKTFLKAKEIDNSIAILNNILNRIEDKDVIDYHHYKIIELDLIEFIKTYLTALQKQFDEL